MWPVPGRCASHGTATYDSSRPAQDSCSLGLLDRTPATDFEEASGAAQAAPGIPVQCVVSERARARNAQCPWFWSTTTSKSQEFGGLQPRDERSRNPSLGLPRVGGEPDRGKPVFSGPVNWWRKRSGTFFSIQARCTSKPLCRTPLQALARASQAERPSRSPASASRCFLPIVRAQTSRARRQARLPDMRLWPTPAARRPA